MIPDFHDLSYLLTGSQRQKDAYMAIKRSKIFQILRPYNPFLAGTIPLGIDIPTSDLDIVTEVYDLEQFVQYMIRVLRHHNPLELLLTVGDSVPMLLVNFTFDGFPFQIIGKPLPVELQNPYRHLFVLARLLAVAGQGVREEIRDLRLSTGVKTLPAFCRYFHLDGDPGEALLNLELLSDAELSEAVSQGRGRTV